MENSSGELQIANLHRYVIKIRFPDAVVCLGRYQNTALIRVDTTDIMTIGFRLVGMLGSPHPQESNANAIIVSIKWEPPKIVFCSWIEGGSLVFGADGFISLFLSNSSAVRSPYPTVVVLWLFPFRPRTTS
jgi:hypothetical protein